MNKYILIIFIASFSAINVFSQTVNSLFFLEKWSQRHKLNASFAPENGYFSLPVFGGTELNFSSNTGLSSYLFPYKSKFVTFMHPSVNGDKFISSLDPNIYFNQGMNVNLLSFGFKTKSGFWSFDCNMRENMNLNIPLDFFRLVKLGFEHQTNQYNLKNLSLTQANYGEISFGYSADINHNIRVGSSVKILAGFSTEKISYSKFDLNLTDSKYEVNAVGESLIMSNDLSINTDLNNYYDISNYRLNFFGKYPAGLGLALDLGVTYKPIKNLTLSAAVNDLGFLSWASKSIQKGKATSNITFSGFTIVNIDSINIQSQLNQLEQDAKSLISFEKQPPTTTNVTEGIPCTINVSAEYRVLGNDDENMRIGLLWNSFNSSSYHSNELIGALTAKTFPWLTVSATYSFFREDVNKLGLALNFSPQWLNFFIASDFVTTKLSPQFLPINKFNMNIQAGFSLYLGD